MKRERKSRKRKEKEKREKDRERKRKRKSSFVSCFGSSFGGTKCKTARTQKPKAIFILYASNQSMVVVPLIVDLVWLFVRCCDRTSS